MLIESGHDVRRHRARVYQAELRAKFDEHKDERDLVKAKKILEEAEALFEEKKHPQPLICMIRLVNILLSHRNGKIIVRVLFVSLYLTDSIYSQSKFCCCN